MVVPTSNDKTIHKSLKAERPVEALLRIALAARLFRVPDGRLYAEVPVGSSHETLRIQSRRFRRWLIHGYHRESGTIPSDWAILRVLSGLEASATFDGDVRPIFVRVGREDGGASANIYLDLGDPTGQAVRIGPKGWSLVQNPPTTFDRPEGLSSLPEPSRDGSIELLRPYVNLDEPDFRLLVVWMAAALRPVGPYPILALYGEQGSAKSTLARVIRLLVDPHATPVLTEPGDARDLVARAVNGWLLAYDNLSVIPRRVSDALCMLATAGGFAHGASSTENGGVIQAQRPVILSGIDEFVARGDLADRSVFLDLLPFTTGKRRCEIEFWNAFHHDYPRILGGLLDAVAGGLRQQPSLQLAGLAADGRLRRIRRGGRPRAGMAGGTVLSDYRQNPEQATAMQLEDSPWETCCSEQARYMEDWTAPSPTSSTSSALAGKRLVASSRWPKSPLSLSKELRSVAPQLRTHDIFITFRRSSDRRFITVSTIDSSKKNCHPTQVSVK